MKKLAHLFFVAAIFIYSSCTNSNGQTSTKTLLPAKEFSEKIKQTSNAILVDVRTPEEYAGGHLENALNININDTTFDQQINKLDKTKPVFVYCLKGGRSAAATAKMQALGFKIIYELEGGILSWRAEHLPEAGSSPVTGMTMQQYNDMLNTDKIVLVDFYAQWCGPCKQMKPFLDEITKDLAQTVKVERIDVDKNQALSAALNIQALPTIIIYKNKKIVWSHVGFVDKATLLEKLK